MAFDPKNAMIERYGPVVRIGVEFKWVEFIQQKDPKYTRKELLAIIEEMDKERTQ